MESDLFSSDKSSLEIQLQSKNKQFDFIMEHNEDFEEARRLYIEIKTLRLMLKELNSK